MHKPEYLFLIGGADLEMDTIKRLLVEQSANKRFQFADKNLCWGAKLSEYQSLFDEEHIFIGIELVPDITQPKHYIEIDHHNNNSYKDSSLEQVIQLLEKELKIHIDFTRELQLIAENDN